MGKGLPARGRPVDDRLTGGVSYRSSQGQDLVDNMRERSGGVHGDATARYVCPRSMQSEYEVTFGSRTTPRMTGHVAATA